MLPIISAMLNITGDATMAALLIPRDVLEATNTPGLLPNGTNRYYALQTSEDDQELHPGSVAVRAMLASGDAGEYITLAVRLTPTSEWVELWVHRESEEYEAVLSLGYLLALAVRQAQEGIEAPPPSSDDRYEILLYPGLSPTVRGEWLGRLDHTPPQDRAQVMASFRMTFPPVAREPGA